MYRLLLALAVASAALLPVAPAAQPVALAEGEAPAALAPVEAIQSVLEVPAPAETVIDPLPVAPVLPEPAALPTPVPPPLRWAPRPAGDFVYGALLADPLENARIARATGFTHIWAYVSWSKVEPKRGRFLFDTKDRWGQTTPNDLTNVVGAARKAGLKLVLRIVDPPG